MADIFEVESNASQDANYREHLNRNWQNGNTEFDKLENSTNSFQAQLGNLQQQIWNLNLRVQEDEVKHDQDVAALTKKHNSDIATLNETIEKQDARISKLEDAVFGLAPADITTPPTPDYPNSGMVEVNFDDRKDKKDKW